MLIASALHPSHSVGDQLHAIAHHVLSEAHEILIDTARPKDLAVHDFRRTMKRWRSFLRLLESLAGEDGYRLRMEARDMARLLSGARNAVSALDALGGLVKAELLPNDELSAKSLDTIRHRLSHSNSERHVWNEPMRQKLTDSITAATHHLAQWNFGEITFFEIADGLARTYRRARRAVPGDWHETSAEQLHELRKRVVVHRYQMEIVVPLWPRFGRMWLKETQRLRNRLGEHQDLATLALLTGPHQPLAPWRSRLAPVIAQMQADEAKSASRIAARLFSEPPKAFRRRLLALWANAG